MGKMLDPSAGDGMIGSDLQTSYERGIADSVTRKCGRISKGPQSQQWLL
jgi:hypothetical protein